MWCQSERVSGASIGSDMLLLDVESGRYIQLNESAAFIWKRIEVPCEASDLVADFAEQFTLSDHEALSDLNKCLLDLASLGLAKQTPK